jgi:histidinol dehydrogenase
MLKIIRFPSLIDLPAILSRPVIKNVEYDVNLVIEDVRNRGDEALYEMAKRFDKVNLTDLKVTDYEFEEAEDKISSEWKENLELAICNIKKFHSAQLPTEELKVEIIPGLTCWKKYNPIPRIGIYVPSGRSPLFSSLYMAAIPARIAEVPEIIACVPPLPDGSIHPSILYVAKLFNITEIFKVGGASAIAAMAFGTKSIKAVDKIVGPGSPYTATAKQILASRQVDIDIVAGASEVLIIADETANLSYVVADMLAQAEHGISSQAVLITTSEKIIQDIELEINLQLDLLPRNSEAKTSISQSMAILVKDLDQAIEISDSYAPEHLIIQTSNPTDVAKKIKHAGSVFIGLLAAEVLGDYGSGTNHILPTGGWARKHGGVGVHTFLKSITFQEINDVAFTKVAKPLANLARTEELEAHARALDIRLEDL